MKISYLLFFVSCLCVLSMFYETRQETTPVAEQPTAKAPKDIEADGDYLNVNLPCKCGALTIYKPGTCGCFTMEAYPELVTLLEKTSAWLESHGCKEGDKKIVGKYEVIVLQCSCALKVYVPKSSGCLGKLYPELEKMLDEIYQQAKLHEFK